MAKEFLGEAALARLIDLIKTEFDKYIKTEEAQELIATELRQMNEALGGKLDRVPNDKPYYTIYGEIKGESIPHMFSATYDPTGTTNIPLTEADGALKVGPPTADKHAVNLKYLKDALDNRIGSLDAALDGILELQDFYTGEIFDELHEYAEDVIAGGES